MTLAHQRFWLAIHSRTLLIPIAATVFMLGGAFFPGPTDPHEAWAFCSPLVAALAAWFVVVVDRAVPPQADAMLVSRAGGFRARRRANLTFVVELAVVGTAVFILVPELSGVFAPNPPLVDTARGALSVLLSATFGGALGLAAGRPVRGGMAFALVVLTLVSLAIMSSVVPIAAGPVGLGREISLMGTGAHASGFWAATAFTCAYVVGLAAVSRALSRWRG